MSPLCKILWIRENQPDVFQRAKKFIGIKEYVFHRLFGEYRMDLSMTFLSSLFVLNNTRNGSMWLNTVAGMEEGARRLPPAADVSATQDPPAPYPEP